MENTTSAKEIHAKLNRLMLWPFLFWKQLDYNWERWRQ